MTSSDTAVAAGRDGAPLGRRALRARQDLLRAARTTLEARGYRNTRVDDIAEEAGYSVGNLYRYFDSKEQIFATLLDDVEHLTFRPNPRSGSADLVTPVVDRVRAANAHYLRSFPKTQRLWAAIEEAALWDESVRQLVVDRWRDYRHSTSDVLTAWREQGDIPADIESHVVVFGLTALTEAAAAHSAVYRFHSPWPYTVDTVTAVWATCLGLDDLGPESGYLTQAPSALNDFTTPELILRPPAQARSTATRSRIVAAASDLIIEAGVQRATIAEIAERAGVSAGALYRHFDSREELVTHVLMNSPTTLSVIDDGGPVADIASRAVHTYFTLAKQRHMLLRSVADRALISSDVRAAVEARRLQEIADLGAVISGWQEQDRIHPEIHPVLAAQSLLDLTYRSGHIWFVLRSANIRVQNATNGIAYVWDRILRPQ